MRAVTTAGQTAIVVAVLSIMSHVVMVGSEDDSSLVPPTPEPWQGFAAAVDPIKPALAPDVVRPGLAAPLAEMADRAAGMAQPHAGMALGNNAVRLGAAVVDLGAAGFELTATAMADRDAVELLQVGRTDFAVVAGALSANDVRAGLRGTLLGVELFALVVPQQDRLVSLRSDQVRLVLTGQVRDWRELGVGAGPITLVVPADAGTAERAALALIPGDPLSRAALRVAGDRAVFDQLLRTPGAIGVVHAAALGQAPDARALAIDGVEPSLDAFCHGRYMGGTPLTLATMGPPSGAAAAYREAVAGTPGAAWLSLPQ